MIGALLVIMATGIRRVGFHPAHDHTELGAGSPSHLCRSGTLPLIRSLKANEEFFVALLIAGIALSVTNMAWAFVIGIAADLFIRKLKITI